MITYAADERKLPWDRGLDAGPPRRGGPRLRNQRGKTVHVDALGSTLARPEVDRLLLDAKFSVPRPRPGTVGRACLVEAARSSDRRLVAVTAPAGYGKSTFLAEWARSEHRPVAWVSLDRFDDDPAMFLVSLAIAFRRAGLGNADLVDGISCPGFAVLVRAAPRVAAVLRASPVP